MIGCALLGVLLVLFFPGFLQAQRIDSFLLQVESREHQKILLAVPVQAGDLFHFQYIHSADKTPIQDTFRVSDRGEMVLIEESFLWYGAGLEFQDHGEVKINYTGQGTTVHLNRPFLNLPLRIGRVCQQKLVLYDQVYRLDKLAAPGECIILSIAR